MSFVLRLTGCCGEFARASPAPPVTPPPGCVALCAAAAGSAAPWNSLRAARLRDLLLQRGGGTARGRRTGADVRLQRERRARRALARGPAQRVVLAERIAFPVVRHLDAPQIGMAVEADAVEVEDLALGPVGARPQIGDASERRPRSRRRRTARARAPACRSRPRSRSAHGQLQQMVHDVEARRFAAGIVDAADVEQHREAVARSAFERRAQARPARRARSARRRCRDESRSGRARSPRPEAFASSACYALRGPGRRRGRPI